LRGGKELRGGFAPSRYALSFQEVEKGRKQRASKRGEALFLLLIGGKRGRDTNDTR